jgi:hypothetical protein
MAEVIEKFQESVFDKMPEGQGPADKKFVTQSPMGIPITKAQEIIQGNQPWATDLPLSPFQRFGNLITPFGAPFGKENRWLMNEEQKKLWEAKQAESIAYQERKAKVSDQLATIFDKAEKRFEETGDEKYKQMALQAKSDILAQSGLTDADFAPVTGDTYSLYDEFGLFRDDPNPYPMVEGAGYMAAGTYGSIKGFQNPNLKPNFGLFKKFMKGAGKGFVRGKGGWLGRVANSIMYGAAGVAGADFGYEVVLDTMNRAGKAKEFMRLNPEQRVGLLDTLALAATGGGQEALTFGPEGINRPDLPKRLENAMDAAVFDAAISSAFFGIRPMYLGLKGFGGMLGGLKTKPPAADVMKSGVFKDLGAPTPNEIIAADMRLAKFDPTDATYIGKEGKAFGMPFGGAKSIPAVEKVQMNIPFIGGGLTRIMKSKAFDWLGPASNKKSEWLPELETIAGTTIPRFSVSGRPYIGSFVNAFQRVPAYGGPVKAGIQVAGEAQKIRAMEMLGRFAPYVSTAEMGVDYIKLATKQADGFAKRAREMDDELYKAAKSAGAIIDDSSIIQTAKDILFRSHKMGGVQGEFNNFLRTKILKPSDDWQPGQQLLTPGKRPIGEMYELKRKMDNSYAKWSKSPDSATIADDLQMLYKSFETDMGSLGKTSFANLTKKWVEYEKFLSNGMLLWGTDAGRKLGNVKRFGYNISVGKAPARIAESFWDTLAKKTDSGVFVKEDIQTLRNIVGDKAYNKGLGHYITKIFEDSMSTVEGIQYINPDLLAKGFGIGTKSSPLKHLFREALPGPTTTEFKIFNRDKNRWENFYDDLFGPPPGSVPSANVKAIQSKLPTYKDFEDLALVLDRVFKYGMPAQSTFLARSTVLQGPQGALKSSTPLGAAAGAYASHAAGGPLLAMASFFGLRYLGKVVTNPIRMRNWKNAMDDTLPEVLRLRNFERLIQAMPDEYEEWQVSLRDMENANKRQNLINQNKQSARGIVDQIDQAIPQVLSGVGRAAEATPTWAKDTGAIGNVMGWNQPPADMAQEAPVATSGSEVGSSITGSNVMNPGAAAELYTGNTDAALANQYGGMNQGGIVSDLNPVMGNDGKFTVPQKGIQDNPFLKQAKDKGII